MEKINNEKIEKYYNTYILGIENFEINKDISHKYFKESLLILEDLKNTNSLINNTNIIKNELECKKYFNLTLKYNIESEINSYCEIDYTGLIKSIKEGNIDFIKKYNYGEINFFKLISKQTLLHIAIKHGDTGFLKYAFKIGASIDTSNGDGHTLLEYACLEQDPNMINFLLNNGAHMKKQLYFREGSKKYFNFTQSIDIAILEKFLIENSCLTNIKINKEIEYRINNIKKKLNLDELIGLNNLTVNNLISGLLCFLNILDYTSSMTYLDIISEELDYDIDLKLGCPKNKIDIIIVNLVPFIDYPFNLSNSWIISLELKYLIIKLIKINLNNIKKELVDNIWDRYIKTKLVSEDFIGTLVYQWITKIKV
jgi:hypothetical protein